MGKGHARKIILSALLIFCVQSCSAVNEKTDNLYLGSYSSVTESECNMKIVLLTSGHGKAVQMCRLEGGKHKDVTDERPFTWKFRAGSIFIYYSNNEIEFLYSNSLSTEVHGGTNPLPGLILKTKGNNIFDGYGDKFWKI